MGESRRSENIENIINIRRNIVALTPSLFKQKPIKYANLLELYLTIKVRSENK